MRILLSLGNPPGAPTGYGGQALQLVEWLHAAGHELFVLPWTFMVPEAMHFRAMPTEEVLLSDKVPSISKFISAAARKRLARGAKIWWIGNPLGKFPCGIPKAALNRVIDTFRADVVVVLQDIFLFEAGPFHCYAVVWMPLHFEPLEFKTMCSLVDFDRIVCMTRYGQALLRNTFHGTKVLDYVPHSRDLGPRGPWRPLTEVWPRAPAAQRAEVQETRRAWQWPEDAHVTLLVASNSEASNRKAFEAQIMGWARFAQRMMDEAVPPRRCFLHLHTNPFGTINDSGGFDLTRVVELMGELPDRHELADPVHPAGYAHPKMLDFASEKTMRVIEGPSHYSSKAASAAGSKAATGSYKAVRGPRIQFTPLGLHVTDEDMARMYRAADVVLAAACAEGFGVPQLEAQACGTPVVTNKTTAMAELTQFGISVPPKQWILRADFNSGWHLPDASGLARALFEVASWSARPAELAARRARGLRVLRARYANEVVAAAWTREIEVLDRSLLVAAAATSTVAPSASAPSTAPLAPLATLATSRAHTMEPHVLSVPQCRDLPRRRSFVSPGPTRTAPLAAAAAWVTVDARMLARNVAAAGGLDRVVTVADRAAAANPEFETDCDARPEVTEALHAGTTPRRLHALQCLRRARAEEGQRLVQAKMTYTTKQAQLAWLARAMRETQDRLQCARIMLRTLDLVTPPIR